MNPSIRIQEKWRKYRWSILAGLAILSATFELVEFRENPAYFRDPGHVIELLVHGVILPVVFIVLQRTDTRKNNAVNNLSLLESFAYQLNDALSWTELVKVIVQFPRDVIPLSSVSLWIFNEHAHTFELEIEHPFSQSSSLPVSLDQGQLRWLQGGVGQDSKLRLCNGPWRIGRPNAGDGHYCLLLESSDTYIGLLHLELPPGRKLSDDQKDFLQSLAPQIVLSIKKAMVQRAASRREQKVEQENRRFANELHDTLGQDLGYLRNRIELILERYAYQLTPEIEDELQQLNNLAQEANQKLRNLITYSQPSHSVGLEARLLAYARAIGGRSNLKVSVASSSPAHELPPQVQFQIFLIFRELLANIERHAHAEKVDVSIEWSNNEMTLTVADNGRGFELSSVDRNEHFGLAIIAARLEVLMGTLTIVSKPNEGTKVSIRIPTGAQILLSSERSLA